MKNNDYINRFLFDETDIRGEIATFETEFQNSFEHQKFPKALIPLFGEFIAGTSLLSEVLKFEGILTLQARGDGDVALIMAETNNLGHFRGIVRLQPEVNIDEQSLHDKSLKELIGNGMLTITIDPDKGKRYQGIVPIESGSLSECLVGYFAQSEQLPTFVRLFSTQTHCGGLFLQCLPAQLVTDKEKREEIWNTAVQLGNTVSPEELFTLANEEVLLRLFHEMQCRVFDPKALTFRCTCDRERSANALQSLGYDDAVQLLSERENIAIDCQFCGKEYTFGVQDVIDIFPDAGQPLH